ncbi:Aste57867_21869 [Aphanomyces stellatus]|uniref:Aste57867_21869 protein n=1 Tax=Aphanomyces stellatus TaxID=120398 RepID=A0A485LIP0_9STRA|nr:hypothetical protein As57867_021800 [Aphanomyces stellatus]VFT98537.1 Aste57867_21869 [Aphanomyces stellatus]
MAHEAERRTTSTAVLLSPELLVHIGAYQRGFYGTMLEIHRHMKTEGFTSPDGSGFQGRVYQIEVVSDILAPWYAQHGTSLLPRLLCTMPYMHTLVAHAAAFSGDIAVLHILHDTRDIASVDGNLIDVAAARGHLLVVEFLHVHGHKGCTDEAMTQAALEGHVDVVAYLATHRTEGCQWNTANRAIIEGCSVEMLSALHDHPFAEFSATTMDNAAAAGRLDLVEFLHAHRPDEGCTTAAMDEAAAQGRLDIVQFLHSHRREGCTTKAMSLAIIYGHMGVVQFLHAHRTEGCDGATLGWVGEAAVDPTQQTEDEIAMINFVVKEIRPHVPPDERAKMDEMRQRMQRKRASTGDPRVPKVFKFFKHGGH